MAYAPYQTDSDPRPRLGLIVLQADETIEDEFRHLLDPDTLRLNISRLPSGADLTHATIQAMETALPAAAALFPNGVRYDAVGYACTSASSQIGSDRVAALIRSGCECAAVTNPLDAAFAALSAMGAKRIGIVSPYTDSIANGLRRDFETEGFTVPHSLSFGQETEAQVARITTGSIIAAVHDLVGHAPVDAVFLSCTNLRTRAAIAELKAQIAVPVLSSNLALAWHMTALCNGSASRTLRDMLPDALKA